MDGVGNEKKQRPWWFLGPIGLFALTIGKKLFVLLKLLKFFKYGTTILTMLVTVGGYMIVYPWQFAVGLVLMLFIHEMGHVIAAKQKGLPVTAPVFVPFLGALIMMKRNPADAVTEAYIAFGGPILGSIGAMAALGIGLWTDSQLCLVIALVGFFLNAINLLPIHPLDGGRIATAVTRWLWLVGLIGGIIIIVYLRSFLFFIIWLLFAWDLFQKYVRKKPRGKKRTIMFSFEIPLSSFAGHEWMIPGENHRRELPIVTYSNLSGTQKVQLQWDAIGLHQPVDLPQQGIVHKVYVSKIDRMPQHDPDRLVVSCKIEYTAFQNDAYYEVPIPIRIKYGIAYGILGLALISFIVYIHSLGIDRIA